MSQDRSEPEGSPRPYGEVTPLGFDRGNRPMKSSLQRWTRRYCHGRALASIGVAFTIAAVVVIAVAVTQTKKNAYPDYSQVAYHLSDTYEGEGFFDQFNYFTGSDPTHGFVQYVSRTKASQLNLTYASRTSAVIKVDTSGGTKGTPDTSKGRCSVRLESKKRYNTGLFIFDVRHTPYACGAWPALWLTDPSNWPDNGEIDVMESINQGNQGNQMTLHTTGECSMGVKRKMTGEADQDDCNYAKNMNVGCGVTGQKDSFGKELNSNGGSIMAMEWRHAGIRMWQFPRNATPEDITAKNPNPKTWGTATADFPSTRCNIDSHFRNNSIVINIALCGDLVYGTWAKSGCPGNCTEIVAHQPDSFKTAFWEFGLIEVYQLL